MKFAKIVFYVAGVWGVLVLTPLYFMADSVGAATTAAGAQFYFGFLAVTMAWQFGFFVVASDPVRFRLVMLPAIVEKVGYASSLTILYSQNRIGQAQLITALPDVVLGTLFIAAFVRTGSRSTGQKP